MSTQLMESQGKSSKCFRYGLSNVNLFYFSRTLKKHLFKIAFQGAQGNLWSSLMSIPEARKAKLCMNENDKCQAKELLKDEVDTENKNRLFVNPEFMANLDSSDGAEQFDEQPIEE